MFCTRPALSSEAFVPFGLRHCSALTRGLSPHRLAFPWGFPSLSWKPLGFYRLGLDHPSLGKNDTTTEGLGHPWSEDTSGDYDLRLHTHVLPFFPAPSGDFNPWASTLRLLPPGTQFPELPAPGTLPLACSLVPSAFELSTSIALPSLGLDTAMFPP